MDQNFENQGIINLISRLSEDNSLSDKFTSLKNPDINDMYKTALSIADGYTLEEFTEFLNELNKAVNHLNEDELDNVVGGKGSVKEKLIPFLEDGSEVLGMLNKTFQNVLSILSLFGR